jgi:glucose/arabinose dehydrogenase
MKKLFLISIVLFYIFPVCFSQIQLEKAFPNLTFSNPVDLQYAGDGTNRIFVVEQSGKIKIFLNSKSAASAETFLDISDRVVSGGEMGLLGLAFHPEYRQNGYFYVNYTAPNPLRTVVSRYRVSSTNQNQADPNSELILLTVSQPYSNHNGGQIAFGPNGFLHIALGDGGSGGDPQNNAQNKTNLLGKILRINVDETSAGRNYSIPNSNPFFGNTSGYREEIFAYGLRNPWRFSFDFEDGRLWCADVGQNRIEEIDIIVKGGNYGWRIMEGTLCYNPSSNCDTTGLILPVWEYSHADGSCSVTGGFVYRGNKNAQLYGKYIYGDYCSRKIWALGAQGINAAATTNEFIVTAPAPISSFGIDEQNELYVCAFDGYIYKFVSTPASGKKDKPSIPNDYALLQNFPNPFNNQTKITFHLPEESRVNITIIDTNGKFVSKIFEGVRQAGIYDTTWNASKLPSGIYFIKMQAESLTSQREYSKAIKVVLAK